MCCCDLLSLCQTSRDGEKLAAAAAAAADGGGDAHYGGIVIEQLVVRLRDDCRTRQRHHRRRCRRRVIVVGSVDHQQRHDSERRRRQRHDGTDDHRPARRIVLAVGRHRQMVHVRAAFHHLLRHGRQHFLDRHAPEPNVSVNYLTILPDVQVCSLAAAAYAPL